MANVEFNPLVEGTKGALSKGGLITRQKTYRDQRGRIIAYGKQEGYFITNPRSFKHNPMVGKELEHHNLWRDVCAQAKEELANPELRLNWELRFGAQIPYTKGTQPDAQAPIDPATGARKRYIQLPAFVRAMIYQARKEGNYGTMGLGNYGSGIESRGNGRNKAELTLLGGSRFSRSVGRTLRGYVRIEPKRAGRRAWAKARATTGTALVIALRLALRIAADARGEQMARA